MKILIAEDNAVSRTLLQAALRAWGYEVVSVTNGIDALKLLQSEDAPPLAILDVEMPGMYGTEVCKRLQEKPLPTPAYIILLTANADKAAAVAGLEAGADDYVTKPFDQGELRARVQVGVRMVELQGSRAKYIRVLEDTFAQLERNSATLTQLNGKMLEEIRDRTRAEEELRLQQILLESQSEASLDGVLVISAEGKIISVNHHFIEIWSLADEVLITKSGAAALQTIADHLDHPGEFLDLADWPLQHADEKSDRELTLKDGRILHYYSAPVKSLEGVYYGRASYFRDITERKRSEEEKAQLTDRLESQRQRLNTFIANTPGMVWEAWGEPDAAMQSPGFVSDYVETMLGYTVEEWITTPAIWLSIIHPNDKERITHEIAANYARGRGGVLEFRWTAKDGHVVWVETQYSIICDIAGKSIGLRGATMDITERKRAQEALSESEEQYRVVAETATDVIITVDENSTILFANGAVEPLFGYSVSELLDKQITILIPEYLRYPPKTTVDSYRQTGRKHIKWEAVEVPGLHKSGREIPLELSFGQFSKDGKRFFTAIVRDITERKRAENAMRKSDERYRDLVENARDIIYTHDLEGNYTSTNRAGEEITGYTREETLKLNLAETIAPEYREKARQMLQGKLAGEKESVYDLEIMAKDGHRIAVEVNTRLVFQGDAPIGVQGIARDVTERRQAEGVQARRAAQLALRGDINTALAESVPLRQILERSTEAIVKHLDAAFARIWTLSKEEDVLELQASAGIYTHIDGPHARVPVGAFKIGLIAKERQPHITNEVNTDPRIGDKEWAKREGMIAFAGYPLIVEDRLIGVIAMFARQRLADDTLDALASVADILSQGIERKLAEEELHESAERYRLLFENNPHPMWVYDLETLAFLAINEAAIQHYGYSREEFLSMTVKDIRPRVDVPALLENISNVSGGINEAGIWRHRKKDGSIIDVEIKSHELLFTGRRAKLVLANDVTERGQLEMQLRQAQKMESIGQLAAGIAHEINTPTQYVGDNLRFIQEAYQAQTQVMEEYGGLFAAAQLGSVSAAQLEEMRRVIKEADLEYVAVEVPKALKQSLEGVERIAKIVQSMKDFAHPDAAEKKPVDLNRAIESTINVARGEWKYVAELETDFDLSLPLVPCLLGELNQMTLNLIINSSHAIAAKMKTAGQAMGVIKITTRHEGQWAVIRISDTGMGIPMAIRSRIFDPFFTTKEVGKGTGQGLAISHTVVEKHGGTITFETADGVGTTFIIRLPLYEIAKTPGGLKEAA